METKKSLLGFFLLLIFLPNLTKAACVCDVDCNGPGNATTCGIGHFMTPAGSCYECNPGYYCTGGTAAPQLCSSGTYNNKTKQDSSSSCLLCPTGYKCPNVDRNPELCTAGTYNNKTGQISCTTCPPGYKCTDPADAPVACGTGYYSEGNTAYCTPCPSGKSCSIQTTSTPSQCLAGTYAANGSASCSACTKGHECPNNEMSQPTACQDGNYQPSTGQSACIPCPAGYHCTDKTVAMACTAGQYSTNGNMTCFTCPTGTYSTSAAGSCTACPAGKECSNPALPQNCASGTYSLGGATSCTTCPNGQIAFNNHTGCLNCAPGYECPTPGGIQQPCPSGTYSNGGAVSCTICPAGQFCFDPKISPQGCAAGTYSTSGSTNCTKCPAGATCSNTGISGYCNSGEYSLESASSCQTCPAGSYCPTKTDAPIPCPAKTYSTAGKTSCTSLNANEYLLGGSPTATPSLCQSGSVVSDDATSCLPCSLGFMCPNPSQKPIPCPPGYYQNQVNQTSCIVCPAAKACPDRSTIPQDCPDGTYSEGGSTICHVCPPGRVCVDKGNFSKAIICTPGTYALAQATGASCTACSAGSYCPRTTDNTELACPPGTYSLGNQANCTVCPAGKACPNPDGSGIVDCQAGEYSEDGASACTQCPAGTMCLSINGTNNFACPSGFYALAGATSCIPCPPGYYCPYTDQDQVLPCTPGHYSHGNATECTLCPSGYACPDTAVSVTNNTIFKCPEGQYSLGGQTECSLCPAGSKCPSIYSGIETCPPGFFSLGNSVNCTACYAGWQCNNPAIPVGCPPGTYSTGQSTACLQCDRGFICPEKSSSPRPEGTECPTGGYCDGLRFYPCPAGTYQPYNQTESIKECVTCPEGYYCEGPGDSSYSTVCPIGYFCPPGTTFAHRFPCPGGKFGNETQQTTETAACHACPEGYFCPEGATGGTICPAGYYCPGGSFVGTQYACPVGTYSNTTGLSDPSVCITCPTGHYCPGGVNSKPSTAPVACPPGTFNPDNGTGHLINCLPCPPGYACINSGQTTYYLTCIEGHYCPNGTIAQNQYPCMPGTYSGKTNLTAASECDICPERYFCGWGTTGTIGSATGPKPCRAGYYCPLGTPLPDSFPCNEGTYNPYYNLSTANECLQCPEGSYCIGGQASPTGLCSPGFYCPNGTKYVEQYACPNGTYNGDYGAKSVADCNDCTQGHYCERAAIKPEECWEGYYMPYGVNATGYLIGTAAKGSSDCIPCPSGYRCPNATIDPISCGISYYSENGTSICLACKRGHYCDDTQTTESNMLTNKKCPAGKLCGIGLSSVSQATNCSIGYYCPEATLEEIPCPVGTYNPDKGGSSLASCLPCPAGYYCLAASSTTTGLCDPGYFCPTNISNTHLGILIGSYGPKQEPCPPRTHSLTYGGKTADDCPGCPGGYYCEPGTNNPVECPKGYYCKPGSDKPDPCPLGSYGNTTLLVYSENCTRCDPGWFCDTRGLMTPTGKCDAGYVCYRGATTSTPTDGVTGEICPTGGYCITGTGSPLPCPPGTFSNVSGAVDQSGCTACTPGYYCSQTSRPEPTGPCDGGFYCNGSAVVSKQHITDPGHYAPAGSAGQYQCPAGTYMPLHNASICWSCKAGYFCPVVGMTEPITCPAGAYCPTGTFEPKDCPAGTFSNTTHLTSQSECITCFRGQYCHTGGLTEPSGYCDAGYVCNAGARSPDPAYVSGQVEYGDLCPAGHYCESGALYAVPCPLGTYLEIRGKGSKSDCRSCPPGYYCAPEGQVNATGLCNEGYYCIANATSATPTDKVTGDICPIGHYCIAGSTTFKVCEAGTYANSTGQAICDDCPIGYKCPYGTAQPEICPKGFACAAKTGSTPDECNFGTFSNVTGLSSITQCQSCPAGYYCATKGLAAPTGKCTAGFYCLPGSRTAQPKDISEGTGGPCPKGNYCPEGSAAPVPCPPGRYSGADHLTAETDCFVCPAGSYCDGSDPTKVTGACSDGYYCNAGSGSTTPNRTDWGAICPTGSKCTNGFRQDCPSGTYQNTTGKTTCVDCPAGFYCLQGSNEPVTCPAGYWCGLKTTTVNENPCPIGTYNNITGTISVAACLACTPGYYCDLPGQTYPKDQCDGGWYCSSGATVARPTVASEGGQCRSGYYCPKGSTAEIPCTAGMYCSSVGLVAPEGNCSAGYYCTLQANTPAPSSVVQGGNICPMGKYCPLGSVAGLDCPIGRFGNTTGNTAITDCHLCSHGHYCATPGLTKPSGSCNPGYYCPPSQTSPSPSSYICPAGSYCISGSTEPVNCPSGYYQDEIGQGSCKVCWEGYFCDNSHVIGKFVYGNSSCPAGHYCPNGTKFAVQYPCPVGTYSDKENLIEVSQCQPCPAGYYCPVPGATNYTLKCSGGYFCKSGAKTATPTQGSDADVCPAGFYCPEGAMQPKQCPLGTYSPTTGITAESDCLNCTIGNYCGELNLTSPSGKCQAGYYCPWKSDRFDMQACPVGHYCPEGTLEPVKCPSGTFSNTTILKTSNDCTVCTPGYYCGSTGLTQPTGKCNAGYYCPAGSNTSQPSAYTCPIGAFCLEGSANPTYCANSTWQNTTKSSSCNTCEAGYYCIESHQPRSCPEGYYCPAGTGNDWKSCPRGTYSSISGLHDISQCKPCDAGKYCNQEHATAPTGDCYAGYYCSSGSDRPNPSGDNITTIIGNDTCPYFQGKQTGDGAPCPAGHYCPQGSDMPMQCPVGTYGPTAGASNCTACPPGYTCETAGIATLSQACPKGYYCLAGSTNKYATPCPAGTYNDVDGITHESACKNCTPGMYCSGSGLTQPSAYCYGGYYCASGSKTPTPSGEGGNKCVAGEICIEGSTGPQKCPGGYYCATERLNATTGQCDPGYFCSLGATLSNPTDATGGQCPVGHYCEAGSTSPKSCPPGTFSSEVGNTNISACYQCPATKYCAGSANANYTGLCGAGYFCTGGETEMQPISNICWQGHYCPTGSYQPSKCPPGTYQDELGKSSCKDCPAGYFCDSSGSAVVSFNNSACPSGYYCPSKTQTANQFPCPAGTYNNITGRSSQSGCASCPSGYYCSSEHLSEPTGLCDAGYYCSGASNTSKPTGGSEGDVCPPGHYCEQGSTQPTACPAGTFNPSNQATSVNDCLNCTGGYYCDTKGSVSGTAKPCQQGYYCDSGATSATFKNCPAGSYCPANTQTPVPCPTGTWSDVTNLASASACKNCTAGYYCPASGQTSATLECFGGYYCPAGSNVPQPAGYKCPTGMYCPNGSSVPQSCKAGYYTDFPGASECLMCPAGSYCLPVTSPDNITLSKVNCPEGYYCPAGTGYNIRSCPSGTYSNQFNLTDHTGCIACPGGSYCLNPAQTTTTGLCSAGYYCQSGVNRPDPSYNSSIMIATVTPNLSVNVSFTCPQQSLGTGIGGICPIGHYCQQGSVNPTPCPAGTYNNKVGQSSCFTCPSGYYCPDNATVHYVDKPCPTGHWCGNGTINQYENPCPLGTYNDQNGKSVITDCLQCPPGKYCGSTGLSTWSGICAAGWYCELSAITNMTTTRGGQCQAGYYCPAGSSAPIACLSGMYCPTNGLDSPYAQCQAGFYCINASTTAAPTDGITGNRCPTGHYCPKGSSWPIKCPASSYNPTVENYNQSACLRCLPGRACTQSGLSAPDKNCSAGFYCPGNQSTATPFDYVCPKGNYCPEGAYGPIRCKAGEYQDTTGSATCKSCPKGYFCNSSSEITVLTDALLCPAGYYCPEGTTRENEYPCPIGTFSDKSGVINSSSCNPCTPGYYCAELARTLPNGLCDAGYFCKQNAKSATPIQGSDANVCPVGKYCPTGSAEPINCPLGTFNALTGLTSDSECSLCTNGSYCSVPGLTGPNGQCSPGYYCDAGSNSSTANICPKGYYCPLATVNPIPCPVGYFSNVEGLKHSGECTVCTAGMYCATLGATEPTGYCDPGYYCPPNTPNSNSQPAAYKCPAANYCPANSSQPIMCKPGTYTNVSQASVCTNCPSGYYCLNGAIVGACPEGFYCPEGTSSEFKSCPRGTYSEVKGLTSINECKQCSKGMYCSELNATAVTGPCSTGYYCVSGADRPNPVNSTGSCNGSQVGVGDACPLGYYCPSGSDFPIACGAGTFANVSGLGSCYTCPAGYYCEVASRTYTNSRCPPGYACPAGTKSAYENACPPGKLNNVSGALSLTDCQPCPSGKYCGWSGLSAPTGDCSRGWTCTGGSATPKPNTTSEGGYVCPMGYFCLEGGTTPQACTAGKYCNSQGIFEPTGNCTAGYYCPQGATSPTQIQCPAGYYCLEGSATPNECPEGTYRNSARGVSINDCFPCTPGDYCNGTARTVTAGKCDQGYYCPSGQSIPNPSQYQCPEGYYCSIGTATPQNCPRGQYQPQKGQSACVTCPAGYTCDTSLAPIDNLANASCITGYYCPMGTKFATEYPCPIGTFNNRTGITSINNCSTCLAGYYCGSSGLSVPTGKCNPGYICPTGMQSPSPAGTECPLGKYCVAGSTIGSDCPDGTYTPHNGSKSITDCESCPAGKYCKSAITANGGAEDCDEGYVCISRATIPNPRDNTTGYVCPVGNYCPKGSKVELPCNAGTYAPIAGQATCWACPASQTCSKKGMFIPEACPAGSYCPNGTSNATGVFCPPGTYSSGVNLTSESECLSCPIGKYCNLAGQVNYTGDCAAGYLCGGGAVSPTPTMTSGTNRLCPIGKYCLQGSIAPIDCPPGSIRPVVGASSTADCWPCPAGRYCASAGAIAATGTCSEGYYCPAEAVIQVPTPSAYICPRGFYCGNGTITPAGCAPGTYQPLQGKTSCDPCPIGNYCPSNSSSPISCAAHSYCPVGSGQPTFCPNGTYTTSDVRGLTNPSQCIPCINGSFCQFGKIIGFCNPGYWCKTGSPTPTPDSSYPVTIGQKCPVGSYCPAGTTLPIKCNDGLVIDKEGAVSAEDCTTCPAGYECDDKGNLFLCTPGYYCPYNITKQPCPIRTFSPDAGAKSMTTCRSCDPGYLCTDLAMTNSTIYPCPLGHFCIEGSNKPEPCPPGSYQDTGYGKSKADCQLCDSGYYCPYVNGTVSGIRCLNGTLCPRGSSGPIVCPAGFYCPLAEGQIPCPPGFYCPTGSPDPIPCPPGYWCGNGTIEYDNKTVNVGSIVPILCPLGYKDSGLTPRDAFNRTCSICPAGSYGNPNRLTCEDCPAGVVCLKGATSGNPGALVTRTVTTTNSYICPRGHYCPIRSSTPLVCKAGSYNNQTAMKNEADCIPCAVDHFQSNPGQTACFPCGTVARQPTTGMPTCTCSGANKEFQASDRSCICQEGYTELQGSCVRNVYDFCEPAVQYRSEDGVCRNMDEWIAFCTQKCGVTEYKGVVQSMGTCQCQVEDLEQLCDTTCRTSSKASLQYACTNPPTLQVGSGTSGSQETVNTNSLPNVINSNEWNNNCQAKDGTEVKPVYTVQMQLSGFTGVYQPNTAAISNLLNASVAQSSTARRLLAVSANVIAGSSRTIRNPIVCLQLGESLLFIVSNESYPEYDRTNLLNSNAAFDYGGFRDLRDKKLLTTTNSSLFAYQFNTPGRYVFKASNNAERKMYVSVMDQGAECSDVGPFFPNTERILVQNGFSISSGLLLRPDWIMIFTMLGVTLGLMFLLAVLLLVFRKHGWAKQMFDHPRYRAITLKYNFDDYSSKGSTVHPVKKYHRNLEASELEGAIPEEEIPPAPVVMEEDDIVAEVKGDEFWDYDKQVDLEGFSTNTLYEYLSRQSRELTAAIGKQKDEAKSLYQKVRAQAESLKGLWVAKLNLKGKSALATEDDMRKYDAKKNELEDELERRRELGIRFKGVLERQNELFEDDLREREQHEISFEASFREINRLLNDLIDNRTSGSDDNQYDEQLQHKVGSRVEEIYARLKNVHEKECERRGVWSLIDQGTGALLVSPETNETLPRDYLFGVDGTVRAPDLIMQDPTTGLIMANEGTQMQLFDGGIVPVPKNFFIHPQTGRALPIEGNVAYDPISSRLIYTADNSSEVIWCIGSMPDPNTGLPVPIVGITIHPTTETVYPVAGSQIDPVTRLPIPIEIGSMMIDNSSKKPVAILGLRIDDITGEVKPLGGTIPGASEDIPLVPGDKYIEPLSGLTVKVTGAKLSQQTGSVLPSGGGYQSLLDSSELACERKLLDCLQSLKEVLLVKPSDTDSDIPNGHHERSMLETAVKELHRITEKNNGHLLRAGHDLTRRLERSTALAQNGGSPGHYEHTTTGQLLPLLVATEFLLCSQLIDSKANIGISKVEDTLEDIQTAVESLTDAAKREVQRRGDAAQDWTYLPPEVVAILTQEDSIERDREEYHHNSHDKFADTVNRFFKKMQEEESKYKERMAELKGAMNPDAEATVTQRFKQVQYRLQIELQEQLLMRSHQLDENIAALEYTRAKADLCAAEAKTLLSGACILAGDYDASISGAYGDNVSSPSSNREIIPLLEHLIKLIEENGIKQYVTTNNIVSDGMQQIPQSQGGTLTIQNMHAASPITGFSPAGQNVTLNTTLLPIIGQPTGQQQVGTISTVPAYNQQTNVAAVSHSGAAIGATVVKGNGVVGLSSISAVSQAAPSNLNKKETKQKLHEKHLQESAELEENLRANEIFVINQVLSECNKKKEEAIAKIKEELRDALKSASTDEERQQIIEEHAKKIEKINNAHEKEKQERLKKIRKELSDIRIRRKKELQQRHRNEAIIAGVDGIETEIPSESEADHDLLSLAKQQEELLAELRRAYAEELAADMEANSAENRRKLDEEMEARMRALNGSRSGDIDGALKNATDYTIAANNRNKNMRDRMQNRKDRRKNRQKGTIDIDDEKLLEGNNEEVEKIKQISNLQEDADRLYEEAALMQVVAEVEYEGQTENYEKVAQQVLQDPSFNDVVDDDKALIVEDIMSELATKKQQQVDEANGHMELIEAKNESIKKQKECELTAEAVKKQTELSTRAMIELNNVETATAVKKITAVKPDKKVIEIEAELKEKHLEDQIKLRLEHREEMAEIERQAQEEQNKALEEIVEGMAAKLEEEDVEFQKKAAEAKEKLSAEEFQKMLDDHEKELESMQQNQEIEIAKHRDQLNSKLEERRRRKQQQLARKQEIEMQKKLLQQQAEADRLNAEREAKKEDAALAETIKELKNSDNENESKRAENLIYHVMQQRHAKETLQHEEQLKKELATALAEAQNNVATKCQDNRDKLVEQHEHQLAELLAHSDGISPLELKSRQRALEGKQQTQLAEFDKDAATKMQEAAKDVMFNLQIQHANARLALKTKQLAELSSSMQELAGQRELIAEYTDRTNEATRTAQQDREKIMKEMEAKLEKIKAEKRKAQEKQRAELAQQLEALQDELQLEQSKDEQYLEEQIAEREKVHEEQRKKKDELMKSKIEKEDLNEDEKQKLIEQHQRDLAELEIAQQREREKSRGALKRKLEERRKKKYQAAVNQLEKITEDDEEATEEEERAQIRAIQQDNIQKLETTASKLETPNAPIHEPQTVDLAEVVQPDGIVTADSHVPTAAAAGLIRPNDVYNYTERDWMALLTASPVFQQICQIENMLSNGGTFGPDNKILGAGSSGSYIDSKDAQWICKGDLIPVDINHLSPSHFVIYRFGLFVVKMLRQCAKFPEVTMLVASNLPSHKYDRNAFRNSYHYDRKRNILFIRNERLESVGDFIVVIMHALAHVKVGDLANDGNPDFLREFYKVRKVERSLMALLSIE
ncbi:uncharacterized protein TRIADDRAFT_51343 [Trichoplax adhaerens]|uniref:TNFR-Cys domain-containing protein n=1 Tax=Trichoplax adhaerens TaxID=10228 RepID=B3RIJ8_TRIAD|nr:hypothetical protein TRIADDRAFT_51343 [Trichoplax adhaerens]EDV28435.1 hypothetical protein TRIADDRAFT_51343 [Trichoplax adhaerens]|eukprot:XP_002107637.1 hypothetical protein TRIADDRAFT_51343 [Trichoplax adhaerens]